MNPGWEKIVGSEKLALQTSNFLNTFNPRNFTSPEVLIRESIQNSMDAGSGIKGIPKIEFHHVSISHEKKSEFLDLFDFKNTINPISESYICNEGLLVAILSKLY